jgi:CDP-6-deoxy-D-xylo-4-hexulose-3-dehydrase
VKPNEGSKSDAAALRQQILNLVAEYHAAAFPQRDFAPGQSAVPVSGKVFDAADMQHLVDAGLDFWLTTGRFAARFEQNLARRVGLRHALLVNSGSSANLLAVSALTSPTLGDRALRPGDEVITVAAGFPTTVNPILQNGCTPVFLDVTLPSYDVDVDQLEMAVSEKTKAVILAHTLGNPFRVDVVKEFCDRHNLWLVEDCCDALGSTYQGKHVGTFGDLATLSFYPAHHITMGEGGAVLTDRPALKKLLESFRDWGRDCWCDPGKDNTCGKRFEWQLADLPAGYDHKYTYSHIGYNLKATDMQAAIGVSQLEKLSEFIAARKRNFAALHAGLADLAEHLLLPEATPGADPSWFGFPLAVRESAPFTRNALVERLTTAKVGTRLLFGGNLIRQPLYQHVPYRKIGELPNSDFVMNQVLWLGVYPGLSPEMIGYVVDVIHDFVKQSLTPTGTQAAVS